MTESPDIINKVSGSGLVTVDLEEYFPKAERVIYDLKQNLFMGQILREKDFREFLKTQNWANYTGKYVGIICSEDAIIPTWAFMLLAGKLQPFALKVVYGNLDILEAAIFEDIIQNIDIEPFTGAKIVIKGCSKQQIPIQAYTSLTAKLLPVAKSLMFGEPCSTVPLFKNK